MAVLRYPPLVNGLQKTLDAQLDQGETSTMTLNNTTNVQNNPGVVLLNRVNSDGTVQATADREFVAYAGTSGSTLTTLTRGVGGTTDQDHAVGTIVEFIMDVTWGQMVVDALNTLVTSADTSVVNTTNVVTPAGTQTLTNKTLTSPTMNSMKAWDGWQDANETWTYASADDPTYTFTVSGVDLTGKYSAGMRVKLTQSTGGTKYFIITNVAFSTDTTITVYGGTDYNLENEAITSPYYSTQKAPQGFPLDPTKWSVEASDTTNRTQATPAQNTWYNLGTFSIDVPIGAWDVIYKASIYYEDNADEVQAQMTLSTANNSESDADWTTYDHASAGGSSDTIRYAPMFMRKNLVLSTKDTYYLNTRTLASGVAAIGNRNDRSKAIIRAVSAYL